MIAANLYEDSIHITSYVSVHDYLACGCHSVDEFVRCLRDGRLDPITCRMSRSRFLPLRWAVNPHEILPVIEVFQFPNPGPTGLFPINQPRKDSPVLISGNSTSTIEVMTAVLSTTLSPFWYLVMDTEGHTVDMAVVYGIMTTDRTMQAFARECLDRFASESEIILPGISAGIQNVLTEKSAWPVTLGPICAAELPLFLGDRIWRTA